MSSVEQTLCINNRVLGAASDQRDWCRDRQVQAETLTTHRRGEFEKDSKKIALLDISRTFGENV